MNKIKLGKIILRKPLKYLKIIKLIEFMKSKLISKFVDFIHYLGIFISREEIEETLFNDVV